LRRRLVAKELIDSDISDKELLHGSFRDIAFVNQYFGGISPVREAILALRPQSVLDVGCGFADLPRAIARDARKNMLKIQITCLDSNPDILDLARQRSADYAELLFVLARGEALPFPARSFDAGCCTLALHHCEPEAAVGLLRELRRVTRHPMIADLRRCYGGLLGAYAFSRLLSHNRLTRHDAPMSVRRAYTPLEALELAREAGWRKPSVRTTPFFRMLLTDES